jgi:hypothetical protein
MDIDTEKAAYFGINAVAGIALAILILAGLGGVYLWTMWSKLGADSAQNDIASTTLNQRRELDSFSAPSQGYDPAKNAPAYTPPPETPPSFDTPAKTPSAGAQTQEQVPDTPSSFDAPQ